MKSLLLLLLLHFVVSFDWTKLDQVMNDGIADRAFPGGVVLIGNATSTLYQNSYGRFTYRTQVYEFPTKNDTMYDVASLTKTMGTASAILSLWESGLLSLDDHVTKYIPQYGNGGKNNTTITHLLLHSAGLLYDYPGPLPPVVQQIMTYLYYVKPAYPIGSKWSYSNLGYIMLGQIVKKITNRTLGDYYHQRAVFMGLKDTLFNPPVDLWYKIAPTEYDNEIRKRIVRGEPHERLSYFLGGETGHSGYFTTAQDVTKLIRLMLNLGKVGNEARIFQAANVNKFISRVTGLPYENTRGLGFDTACPGTIMKNCFGHDGSTGAMMWADRDHNITIVVLTNRGHPLVNNGKFDRMKGTIADTVMEILGY